MTSFAVCPSALSNSFASPRRILALGLVVAAMVCLPRTAHAGNGTITPGSPVNIGSSAVGTAHTQVAVTFTVSGSVTLATTPSYVLTQGAQNQETLP